MYYVGIDWSDQHHDIAIADQTGKCKKEFRVAHNREGLESLKEKLLKLDPNPESFVITIETKHGLLISFLLENGFPVYPLNPKIVDNRRKPSGAKSDPIDARLLSDIGRTDFHNLHRLKQDSEIIQELKLLTRDQEMLIAESTRINNRLIACLKEYYPAALEFFADLTRPVAIAFLKHFPTIGLVREREISELGAFLKTHKHPKHNQTAIKIWQTANALQIKVNPVIERAKSRLMLSLLNQLEPLQKEIENYDKEILRLFQSHPDSIIFSSLPWAAKRLAPRMLAEWGDDRTRYINVGAVQALAGTSPVLHQSGKYRYARQRKSCIKPFRRTMQLFAFSSLQVAWARAYYDKKKIQGKTHQEALRALANVWIRIIHAMWLTKTPYDESRFLAAQIKHAKAA
jgi:transposase